MRAALVVAGAVVLPVLGIVSPAAQSAQDRVYRPGQGVTDPTLVRQATPKYTRAAMQARIQGVVELEAVVLPDGTVGDVRVVKSLDERYGLDAEAVAAAKAWLFKPGQLEGKAVPVLVTLVLEFRLHNQAQSSPQDPDADFTRGTHRQDETGVVPPKATKRVSPKYTSDAMRQKIQGVVVIEAVVGEDGKVARARVKESLDTEYGLDQSALDAAGQYEFTPGTFEGRPAAILITLTMEFRLHDTEPISVKRSAPKYPAGGELTGGRGTVAVEGMVGPDGVVREARVIGSLDGADFDREALAAVAEWRFLPGLDHSGEPVAKPVRIELEFVTYPAASGTSSVRSFVRSLGRDLPGHDAFTQGAHRSGDPGVADPKVVTWVAPKYTPEAMRSGTRGGVLVEAVVLKDGTVGRARIKKGLDDSLDQAALDAAFQYRFLAGTYEGRPAPVLITLRLEFGLQHPQASSS